MQMIFKVGVCKQGFITLNFFAALDIPSSEKDMDNSGLFKWRCSHLQLGAWMHQRFAVSDTGSSNVFLLAQ